jgi:hypothetical protein
VDSRYHRDGREEGTEDQPESGNSCWNVSMTGRPQDYRYEAAASSRDTYFMPDPCGENPTVFEKEKFQ